MQKISSRFGFLIAFAAATAGVIHAQGRSAPDWTTDGADAQRSSWIAVDPWISIDTMPQLTLLWKLKVDNDRTSAAIVGALVGMAHTMGLTVTAEGVETEEQMRFLKARRCDAAQGYLFARPMTGPDLREWLGRDPHPSVVTG